MKNTTSAVDFNVLESPVIVKQQREHTCLAGYNYLLLLLKVRRCVAVSGVESLTEDL